jgi:hypothetical protein
MKRSLLGGWSRTHDVVKFYNTRFRIGFMAQEKEDLINFLNSL